MNRPDVLVRLAVHALALPEPLREQVSTDINYLLETIGRLEAKRA